MKSFYSFFAFIICVFLSTTIAWSQAKSQYGQSAEYLQATAILVHEPGDELFLGVMHPLAALFEDYLHLDKVSVEHNSYCDRMEACGARVFKVRDVLLEGTCNEEGLIKGEKLNKLRKLAIQFLSYDTDHLSQEECSKQESYRNYVINEASPKDLVSIIMRQPKVVLSSTRDNTKLSATYTESPISNLFYTRDQMITTAKGGIIGKMNSSQRKQECDIIQFCLEKIGMPAIYRIEGDEAFLEGGDFYPFGNMALIGCGMRTTQPAIDQLMEHDLLGCDTLAVVKDRLFSQAQMHLDTYFNIIDRNLVTLSENRMTSDVHSKNYLLVDLYVRDQHGRYKKSKEDIPFVELLQKYMGTQIIPISEEDCNRLANNFLTIGPRHILAVAGQSEKFSQSLKKNGVKVDWISLDNLIKGYGAAHCMTQVLIRK